MTIKLKIIGSLTLVALFSLIFGIIGLISTHIFQELSSDMNYLQEEASGSSTVLNAHYSWCQKITESVLFGTEFTGSLDPNTCALGTWLNGEVGKNITDPEALSLLNQIKDPHALVHNSASIVVDMIKNGELEAAKQELEKNILPTVSEVISKLSQLESRYNALMDEDGDILVNTGKLMSTIIIILLACSSVLVILMNWKITESIMKPIYEVTKAAETIATGDLDINLNYNINDQIGQLFSSFKNLIATTKEQSKLVEAMADGDLTMQIKPRSEKDVINYALIKMMDNLNNMFADIQGSSSQVALGSKQIADGVYSLSQGSTEQTMAVETLSTSINQITDQTNQNAHIAKEASALSGTIKVNAEKGSSQMTQMMQAVQEINDASGQIEKVIKVIDDIAFQTNILALNAAVEAARAGSAGKGFAVVAEEVRNLAAKSAEAAKDTSSLIENSVSKANIGLGIATETSASLNDIVEGINKSAEIIFSIASSSDQQAEAISQVNQSIEQIAQVARQNAAISQESAAASEEMSGQSDILEQLISQFKIRNNNVSHSPITSAPKFSSKKASNISNDSIISLTDKEYGKY